jgi:hypothetical protein
VRDETEIVGAVLSCSIAGALGLWLLDGNWEAMACPLRMAAPGKPDMIELSLVNFVTSESSFVRPARSVTRGGLG